MDEHSFLKVEAIKCAYKQSREGDIVTFRIQPQYYKKELATAPLGTRVMLAIAEIRDDESLSPLGGH